MYVYLPLGVIFENSKVALHGGDKAVQHQVLTALGEGQVPLTLLMLNTTIKAQHRDFIKLILTLENPMLYIKHYKNRTIYGQKIYCRKSFCLHILYE